MFRIQLESSIDLTIIICTGILLMIGEAYIYSSSIALDGSFKHYQFIRQLIWIFIGAVVMCTCAKCKMDLLLAYSTPIFFVVVTLLLLLGLMGTEHFGARAWIRFLGLGIQPSEFAKFSYILLLSKYLGSRNPEQLSSAWTLFVSLVLTIVPMGLVVYQGDVGTALVFAPIWFISLYVLGGHFQLLNYIFLFFVLLIGLLFVQIWEPFANVGSFLWTFAQIFTKEYIYYYYISGLFILFLISLFGVLYWKLRTYSVAMLSVALLLSTSLATWFLNAWMKPYMKDRIISFFNPDLDKLASGWNLTQSVRAIGSGGLWGKGYLKGEIAHYGYLPEQSQSTDFLFSIIGEEGGFVMALVVFIVYFILIMRILLIARFCRDHTNEAIALGISAMFCFHFVQNVGMAIHLLPITGIPLLLVSYGGSSLITAMGLLGLVLNIYHTEHKD